VNRIKKEKV